jgi:hypothetical protein
MTINIIINYNSIYKYIYQTLFKLTKSLINDHKYVHIDQYK